MSRLPDKLDVAALDEVLGVAEDPEREYAVRGWILRSMARELLAIRAKRRPPRRPRKVGPLPGQMDLPIFGRSI